MRQGAAALVMIGAALAASCGPSPAQVVNRYRPSIEAKLAAIRAVEDRLPSEPVPTGAAFVLEGPPPEFAPSAGKVNAIVMEPDHFRYPEPLRYQFRLSRENPIADPVSLLKTGEFHGGRAGNSAMMEKVLREFGGLKYLLVIRNLEVREAALTPGRRDSFTGGSCEGDALLFDLDLGRSVGGFRFSGSSSEQVSAQTSNPQGFLGADLRINTVRIISTEFTRRFPGATPPYSRD